MAKAAPNDVKPGDVLGVSYFDRAADIVARDLLGCALCRQVGSTVKRLVVRETEAYLGPHDLASHSARGRTQRTEVMFGPPGTLYVYLVYGLHHLLNVVTGPIDEAAAVLIRSAGDITGPGRLGSALEIDLSLNGHSAIPDTGLWFEHGVPIKRTVRATPRIGVDYAGPRWSSRKLRFVLG